MFKIDNATVSASAPTYPSPGTPGHFTKGNPGGGVAATVVDDWWLDQIENEIANVITDANIVLAKGTNTQLRDSLRRLASINATSISVDTALTAAQTGLILINAAAGSVTVTLPAANANAYQSFSFRRVDGSANLVTIQRAGGDSIDQGALFRLWTRGHVRAIKTDGVSAWSTLSQFSPLRHGRCYFQRTDATHVTLVAHNGDGLQVNGEIHSLGAGITSANAGVYVGGVAAQNLAASTCYLVFVFDNNGVLTFDFWPLATGHLTDTSTGNVGVEVRSNGGAFDSTRTLVGMVLTDGAGQFQDSTAVIGVLSWFNRTYKSALITPASSPSTSSASTIELTTAARAQFICWAGNIFPMMFNTIANNGSGNASFAHLGIDGVGGVHIIAGTQLNVTHDSAGATRTIASTPPYSNQPEGSHYLTIGASVSAGTSTWTGTGGFGTGVAVMG